jgi:hypothetical protein
MNASHMPTAAFRCLALQQARRSTKGRCRTAVPSAGQGGLGSRRIVALWLGD